VKLGVTADPARRLKQLQTGHPDRLTIYHHEPVEADLCKAYERLLHRDINYLRRRGEWFDMTVAEAISHVQFTIIQYGNVTDLVEKVRTHRV